MGIRQVLHEPDHVVAEIADQPSEKTRQGLRLVGPERGEQVPQFLQRVAGSDFRPASPLDLQAFPETGKGHQGIKTDKGIPAPLFPALQAFKQKGMGIIGSHLGKNGQGRIKICHYFPVDRDKSGFGGQVPECFKVGFMHEHLCSGDKG